jgi:hypothetical protein
MKPMIKNKIVVIGGNHHNGLGIIRSLGEYGCRVSLIVVGEGKSFVTKSRYLEKRWIVNNETKVLSILLNEFNDKENKTIILPAGDSGVSSSDSASNSKNSGGEEAGGPDGSSNDSAQVSEGDDTCDDSSSPGNNSDDISPQQNSDGNTETPGSEEKGSEDEAGFVDGVEDPVDSIDSAAVTTEDSVTSADSDEDLSLMTMGLSSQEDPSTGTPADEEVTLPEYQIPSGSAYIVGSEDTVYYNTATQNAIQQAVEAAKAAAASQVTIVVSNGVYAGGIKLIIPAPVGETGDGSPEPACKMLLQIIAEDAYTTDEDGNITPNANSAGGVDVEGDLDFDGINLLLAGLYLSLRSTINAKNADTVTYFGTSQDDEVKINLDNVSDSIFIDSGGGDDVLDISVSQSPYRQAARV